MSTNDIKGDAAPESIVSIRNATRDEVVEHFAEQASIEKWNPGLYDAACHWEFDSNGFFVAVDKNESGKIISCILGGKGGTKFGFIGYFITIADYRKRGIGTMIMKHCLKYLDGRVVALDAVEDQVPYYEKLHFQPSFKITRFVAAARDLLEASTAFCRASTDKGADATTVSATNANDSGQKDIVSQIVAYDAKISPVPREKFLRAWLTATDVACAVAEDKDSHTMMGYISIRRSENGWRVNPLFAESSMIAVRLVKCALESLDAQSIDMSDEICIDVPARNSAGAELFQQLAMKKGWNLYRMYLGDAPDFDEHFRRVFGITAAESQLL